MAALAAEGISHPYKLFGNAMIELLILACLLKDPSHCEEFRVPFVAEMSVAQCMWQSAIQAAEWTSTHPDWVIRKLRCGLPRA